VRNVTRVAKPTTLTRNAKRWKQELLAEIASAEAGNRKLKTAPFNRYNKPEVKDALDKMYHNLCCYCEGAVGDVAKPHIEHRKPKAARRFPELAFDWENLHLACPNCNSAKSDKWNRTNEILDAVTDHPIDKHLSYKLGQLGPYRFPKSKQGSTTVEHADLNRKELLSARTKVLLVVLEAIKELKALQGTAEFSVSEQMLRDNTECEYGSLIEYAIAEYLE